MSETDIIERLLNFDRFGTSAIGRVELREQSAIEIAMLRGALERIAKLSGTHDLVDARRIAEDELRRSKQFCPAPRRATNLNSIDARLERMRGRA